MLNGNVEAKAPPNGLHTIAKPSTFATTKTLISRIPSVDRIEQNSMPYLNGGAMVLQ